MVAFALMAQDPESTDDVLLLPTRIRTRYGDLIDTDDPLWRFRVAPDSKSTRIIRWSRLMRLAVILQLSERDQRLIKLFIADQLVSTSSLNAYNHFGSILFFLRWCVNQQVALVSCSVRFSWADVTEDLLRTFLADCRKHRANRGHDFARFRLFYKWAVAHRYQGFDRDLLRALALIKAGGNLKGHHVRSRNPLRGPLSPDEMTLLRQAIVAGLGRDPDRAVVMVHLELGHNPHATARMKNKDLKRYIANGETKYHLHVPRMKKRKHRRETRARLITTSLGELLERLMQGKPDDPLFWWLTPHHPERAIYAAMQSFVREACIVSPRTGDLLKLHPRRIRYTIASGLAADGASKMYIADVLDHSTLLTADIYIQTSPGIVDAVAEATDPILGPLVQRFLGEIIDARVDPGAMPVVPASTPHIPVIMLNVGGVGRCGRDVRADGLCRLMPPLSCYQCPSFRALSDGPHQEVLEQIDAFIQNGQGVMSERILHQLDEVRRAIVHLLTRLETYDQVPINNETMR